MHTSKIACKSLAFRFLPIRVTGPSSVNGWLSVPSLVGANIGRSSTGTSGEVGVGSMSGLWGGSAGDRGSGEC